MSQSKRLLKYLFVLMLLGGCTTQTPPVEDEKEQEEVGGSENQEVIPPVEESKELVVDFTEVDVNGQYKVFWDHHNQMKDKEKITLLFNENEIYLNSKMIQELAQKDADIALSKGNRSVILNSSDLKDNNWQEKFGHYSLDKVMEEKKTDISLQVLPFSVVITDVTEDGYTARGNSALIHPDVYLNLKTDNKNFKKGDLVDFVAPADIRFFKEGNADVNCLAILASKTDEKYDYRLWDEAYEYQAYYAKAGEPIEIVIDEKDVNIRLSDFNFNELSVDQVTLKYKDKTILWTEEMAKTEFNMNYDYLIHMPLVYSREKITMNEVITVETACIIDLNDNGFIAVPAEDNTFNGLEYFYVPIKLPEAMETGDYVEISYQKDDSEDNMMFWYVKWIPAPVKE